jgi:hypothetical protein
MAQFSALILLTEECATTSAMKRKRKRIRHKASERTHGADKQFGIFWDPDNGFNSITYCMKIA